MIECDVLVVGAGPAGSMAAKTAAENGISVILIEEHCEIGVPVQCAEGINNFFFKDTGVKKNKSFIRQRINGTKIYFYDEVYDLSTKQWKGYTIDRSIFDKELAKSAEQKGAILITDTRAISMTKKDERIVVSAKGRNGLYKIQTNIVIGAGGFGCQVGRWARIKDPWKLCEFTKCLEYKMRVDLVENDKFHFVFGDEFLQGYGFVFPVGQKSANIGVGVGAKLNARKALEYFINKYPSTNKIIRSRYSIEEIRGGCIPMIGPLSRDRIVSDGIILVGDAAGIVDPITGEGIGPGMLSGIAAGEVAVEAIIKGDYKKSFLNKYYEMWRNKVYLGETKLGDYLDVMLELKGQFYCTFSKKCEKIDRENLILTLLHHQSNSK